MAKLIYYPSDYKGTTDFVHLHNHTVYSVLDGIATPEQYADECKKRGYPAMSATEHGHMASVPDMYFAFKKQKLKAIPGCFLPSQKIYTSNGIKELQNIDYVDRALSHTNNYRKIKNVQVVEYDGDMIRLKAWCVEDQLVTPEHPFLVREVQRSEISKGVWDEKVNVEWRKASELYREKYWRTYATKRSKDRSNKRRYRFYFCVPRLKGDGLNTFNLTEYIFNDDATPIVSNGFIDRVIYERPGYKTSRQVNLPNQLPISNILLWIMGLWLAEGSLCSDTGGLVFSLCSDEFDFYQRISDYFAQFNISTGYNFRNKETDINPRESLEVTVYSTYFARLFTKLFGVGFADKRIDDRILFGVSAKQAYWLLEGLLDGDAKRSKYTSYLKLNNETLIWQARLLMTKLEVPQYSAVTILPCNNSENLSYCIRKRESGHFYYDYDDDFIYLPIYDTSNEYYKGDVYNLEVDKDNSYNSGVATHNCEIYYNDYEPLRKKMVADGAKIRGLKESNLELSLRIGRNRHLTILCKNQVGFHNLIKLTSDAYTFGLYYKPRIWFEKLCEYKEGLIVLSGCMNGPPAHEIRLDAKYAIEENRKTPRDKAIDKTAIEYIKMFHAVFKDDYYIEVQMPCLTEIFDYVAFWKLIEYADDQKIKVVLANDAHYLNREDFYLQKVMMAVEQKVKIDDPNLFHVNSDEQYMKTRAELWATFKNNRYSKCVDDRKFEEMCDNTLYIAEQCAQMKMDTNLKIPDWSTVEKGENADTKLIEITREALKSKGLDKNKKRYLMDGKEVTYTEQAAIELDRFISKGFASYFMITRDLLQYGKTKGYPFGPRGSVGGSLVCHLIGIHALDPLKWQLSFDRFMASSRGGYQLKVTME